MQNTKGPHFLMIDVLTSVSGGQSFVHLCQKPLIMIHKALDCFRDQGLGRPLLVRSHLRELAFQFRGEMYIHAASVRRRHGSVKTALG